MVRLIVKFCPCEFTSFSIVYLLFVLIIIHKVNFKDFCIAEKTLWIPVKQGGDRVNHIKSYCKNGWTIESEMQSIKHVFLIFLCITGWLKRIITNLKSSEIPIFWCINGLQSLWNKKCPDFYFHLDLLE